MKTNEKLVLARKQVTAWQKRREDAIRLLVKAETKLPGLAKAVQRLERRQETEMVRRAQAAEPPASERLADAMEAVGAMMAADNQDLAIPGFLKRTAGDAEAAARVRAEVEALAKEKARVATERRKVKAEHKQAMLTGKTRRMPLTGKDALKAINA